MLWISVNTPVWLFLIGSTTMADLNCSEHQAYAQLSRGKHGLGLWTLCLVAWQFGTLPVLLDGGGRPVRKRPWQPWERREKNDCRRLYVPEVQVNPQRAASGNLVGMRGVYGAAPQVNRMWTKAQQILAEKWSGSSPQRRVWKLLKNSYVIKVIFPSNFCPLYNCVWENQVGPMFPSRVCASPAASLIQGWAWPNPLSTSVGLCALILPDSPDWRQAGNQPRSTTCLQKSHRNLVNIF